jgi:integrase/recombinase XerD
VEVYYFFPEFLEKFELFLRLKGRSEMTIETYCRRINQFLRSVNIPARQVSKSDIKKYVRNLFEKKYAVGTINGAIIALKIFYRFLHSKGLIFSDPTQDIMESENEKNLPKCVLLTSEMEAIRLSLNGNSILNLRDRAIIEVLYATGLRLSELTALNISDLDLNTGSLLVQKGKGGKDRQSILNRAAVSAVSNYLKERRKTPDHEKALWINHRGKRLSGRWIGKMLKKAAENAGLEVSANPHAWRHGVAIALLRKGASIRAVQVFLGHSRLKTTQIYTQLSIRDLQKAHGKTHPREMDPIPENINPTFLFPVRRSLDEVVSRV